MEINIVSVIQAMLAPAIMVSACGLLLLSINNKYSMVVTRIRSLDEEIRRYKHNQHSKALEADEQERLNSLFHQIGKLSRRVWLIRNAVVSYYIAVALFITTCLVIGLEYAMEYHIYYLIVVAFLAGMLSVMSGIIFSIFEARRGYEIILMEVEDTMKIQ